jgi:tetratricopeptide (TPR) repeat protein
MKFRAIPHYYRTLLGIFSCSCVLVGATVWLVIPLYKLHQQNELVLTAVGYLASKEPVSAMTVARHALEMNSRNLSAMQVMAEAAELQGSADALTWRHRIVELAPALSNRIALVATALKLEDSPFPQAAKALDEFDAAGRKTTDYHRLSGELALKLRNLDEAEAQYQAALEQEPQNDEFNLKLSSIQLAARDAAVVAKARDQLDRLSRHPRLGAEALRHLSAYHVTTHDLGKAQVTSQRLLRDVNVVYSDRLGYLTILKLKGDPEFSRFLAELQRTSVKDPDEVYQLGKWMSGADMADEGLKWLQSLPFGLQWQQPVPKAVAACYEAKKDWFKLEAFLREQTWGEEEYIRTALMAHALFNQGEQKLAHANWQKSVQLAADRIEQSTELVRLAQSWTWPIEAEELLWQIVSRFPDDRSALRSLYRYYLASDNTMGLYKVHTALVKLDSSETTLKSKVASLSFLLNTEINKAQELAHDVFTKDPRNAGFVSTYAYSLHLQGKTSDALKLMSSLPPSELEVPEVAAYYGILLAAAGEPEKARKYLAMAERAQILPQDKKLLLRASGM